MLGFQSSKAWYLQESWRVFHDRLLLGRCFLGIVLPVLEYCSAVWCSAADTHLKLLDRVVSGARFLTGGVFEFDIAHRRSVAVLCMLYTIRCSPMQPLYGDLPVPSHISILVPHRYTSHWWHIGILMHLLAAEPHSNADRPLFPSQCPCRTNLLTLYSMVWDWRVSRARPVLFYLPMLLYPFLSSTTFPFLFFLCILYKL